MMFPCPGFPPALLPFPVADDAVEAGVLSFCGGGSSSEKDSHAGCSFVTIRRTRQYACPPRAYYSIKRT